MIKNSLEVSWLVSGIAGNEMKVNFTPNVCSYLLCNIASILERMWLFLSEIPSDYTNYPVDRINTKKIYRSAFQELKNLLM